MPESLKQLVQMISMLPWIWEKTATKLAFFLLNTNKNYLDTLSDLLWSLKKNIWFCEECHSLIEKWDEKCIICIDSMRDSTQICIVEEYLDMVTIEQTSVYKWLYHILGGAISPVNWVFASDLNIKSLVGRIEKSDSKVELILATNPNIEWEATAMFIKESVEKSWLWDKASISRLSKWLSSWYIEYADNITLINAIKDRKQINS